MRMLPTSSTFVLHQKDEAHRLTMVIATFVEEAMNHGVDFDLAVEIAHAAAHEIFIPSLQTHMEAYNILRTHWLYARDYERHMFENLMRNHRKDDTTPE